MTRIIIILAIGVGFLIYYTGEYFQKEEHTEHVVIHDDGVDAIDDHTVERDRAVTQASVTVPLDTPCMRVSKKPFGIFIDRDHSPVQPERFQGYHTGVDLEVFDTERDQPVEVRAICDGEMRMRQNVSGYGGVVVQACKWKENDITVIYGHLSLETVAHRIGETVSHGEVLGTLGNDGSADTDGERKHLHLGIHKGRAIVLAGYVMRHDALSQWIDPCTMIQCQC